MFEEEIKEYEDIRKEYQQKIADRMSKTQWMEYNEVLFSANSCAIEGNSFTVDVSALKKIRTEGTDEFLIAFFFQTAIKRMKEELAQKINNSLPMMFF